MADLIKNGPHNYSRASEPSVRYLVTGADGARDAARIHRGLAEMFDAIAVEEGKGEERCYDQVHDGIATGSRHVGCTFRGRSGG